MFGLLFIQLGDEKKIRNMKACMAVYDVSGLEGFIAFGSFY